MKTSITVVVARWYSFASGDTDEEIEQGMSPSTSVDERGDALLVRRADVGVDEADGDAVDVAALEPLELLAHVRLVERDEDVARRGDALANTAAEVAGDERRGRVAEGPPPAGVGQRLERPPRAGRVERVAVAERRDRSRPSAAAA